MGIRILNKKQKLKARKKLVPHYRKKKQKKYGKGNFKRYSGQTKLKSTSQIPKNNYGANILIFNILLTKSIEKLEIWKRSKIVVPKKLLRFHELLCNFVRAEAPFNIFDLLRKGYSILLLAKKKNKGSQNEITKQGK